MEVTKKTFEENSIKAQNKRFKDLKAYIKKENLVETVQHAIEGLQLESFDKHGWAELCCSQPYLMSILTGQYNAYRNHGGEWAWCDFFELSLEPDARIDVKRRQCDFYICYYHKDMVTYVEEPPKGFWTKLWESFGD